MYSKWHYLTRSTAALEMAENPENARQKKDYLALSVYWKKLADAAVTGFHPR
jgi:hypothetical protein